MDRILGSHCANTGRIGILVDAPEGGLGVGGPSRRERYVAEIELYKKFS